MRSKFWLFDLVTLKPILIWFRFSGFFWVIPLYVDSRQSLQHQLDVKHLQEAYKAPPLVSNKLTSHILSLHDDTQILPSRSKHIINLHIKQISLFNHRQDISNFHVLFSYCFTFTATGTKSDCSTGNFNQTPFFPCKIFPKMINLLKIMTF